MGVDPKHRHSDSMTDCMMVVVSAVQFLSESLREIKL
jgi:hypothetical protein